MSDDEEDVYEDAISSASVIDAENMGLDGSRPYPVSTSILKHGVHDNKLETRASQSISQLGEHSEDFVVVPKAPVRSRGKAKTARAKDSADLKHNNTAQQSRLLTQQQDKKDINTGHSETDNTYESDHTKPDLVHDSKSPGASKVKDLIALQERLNKETTRPAPDIKPKPILESVSVAKTISSDENNKYSLAKDVPLEPENNQNLLSSEESKPENKIVSNNDSRLDGNNELSTAANINANNEQVKSISDQPNLHPPLKHADVQLELPTATPTKADLHEDNIYDSVHDEDTPLRRVFSKTADKSPITEGDFEVIPHKHVTSNKHSTLDKDNTDATGAAKSLTGKNTKKFKELDHNWSRKQAKKKSNALKRSKKPENPFIQHPTFDNPHHGAMPDAEDEDIIAELNPIDMLHDDSNTGSDSDFSDSTFDSSDDEPEHVIAERRSTYSDKPLPPKPAGKQVRQKGLDDVEDEGGIRLQRVVTKRLQKGPSLPDGPSGLSSNQIKLRGVLQSLIDSERGYTNSLDRLVNVYQEPIITQFGVKKTEVKETFKQVENILSIHNMFQLELKAKLDNWYIDEKIGAIFNVFSQKMVIDFYSVFVNNFEVASEVIKDLENSKQNFKEFLRTKQMSSVDRLSLSGLMLKPIQRFPQFIMIIKDLLKFTPRDHHDREPLQEGLTGMENVAHQLNERKRQSEQYFHGQQILVKLAPRLQAEKNVYLIRQDDMQQLSQDLMNLGQNRICLMNRFIVCGKIRDQEGSMVEKFTYKWHRSLKDLELTTSAITPNMTTTVHMESGNTTIRSPKTEMFSVEKNDDDPVSIAEDLTNMMYDISVLAKITHLVSTLKMAYPGLSEESLHEITTNLQKEIQGKDYQLQMLNSSTIIIQDKVRKKRYIFSASSSHVKQEWCIDFLLAKCAQDIVNIPSWYKQDQDPDKPQNIMLMKHMSVDMQRTFTHVKCGIRMYFPTKNEGCVEHLWVCSSNETQGQVSLVSLHTAKPGLIESFQATSCEILAVEMVPGFALVQDNMAWDDDTIWMSTVQAEVLVFMLCEKQSGSHRRPVYTFQPGSPVICMTYEDDRVFCGTRSGVVVVYTRNDEGVWSNGPTIQLGPGSATSMIAVNDALWTACGPSIYVINSETYKLLTKIDHASDTEDHFQCLVKAGVGVWASFIGKPNISLYHSESKRLLQDFNICTAVNEFITVFSGQKQSRRNHEVTTLMASLGFLWVGTSIGIILTYPLPRLRDGVPRINQRPQVALHGHNSAVKFIIPVHYGPISGVPIRRRASSILGGNKVDGSVIKRLPPVRESGTGSNSYISLDAAAMASSLIDSENLYDSINYKDSETSPVNSKNSQTLPSRSQKSVKFNSREIKVDSRKVSTNSYEEIVLPVKSEENRSKNTDTTKTDDVHKYFILEPGSNTAIPADGQRSADNNGGCHGNTNHDHSVAMDTGTSELTNPSKIVNEIPEDSKTVNSSSLKSAESENVEIRPKTGRNSLSFKTELKNKLRSRVSIDDLTDYDVTDDNVDRLYPTLRRPSITRTLDSHKSLQSFPEEPDDDSKSQTYTRSGWVQAIPTKKPDMTATRVKAANSKDKDKSNRRFSFPIGKQGTLPSGTEGNGKTRKASTGSSFAGGSSLDTLRKQDSNTIMVLSGGDGYKDWKSRQSLVYRPEEPCLTFWMYKF